MASSSLKTVLGTSLALIDQFITSLKLPVDVQPSTDPQPSPLHLLSAAANTLKSTTTKLSLLTITAPFTPSAIASILQPLNTSILTSLVTATLLTSTVYPESFSKECISLTTSTLRDLQHLLLRVRERSEDGEPKKEIGQNEKTQITESTGKIWEDCDMVIRFVKEDISGFAIRKAKEWLALMKDAVQELEEWDPEEEDINDQDWLGLDDTLDGDDDGDGDEHDLKDGQSKPSNSDRATISAGVKKQALTVLSRIPQSVHIVIKHRLETDHKSRNTLSNNSTQTTSTTYIGTIDLVVRNTRRISDCIDESAEAMYLGDSELCLKKAGEARALAIDILEAALIPVSPQQTGNKDHYIEEALANIQQVDTGSKVQEIIANRKGLPIR